MAETADTSLETLFEEAVKYVNYKFCKSCGTSKPIEEFYLRRDRGNGSQYRMSKCKSCNKKAADAWIEQNKEAYQAAARKRSLLYRHKDRLGDDEAASMAVSPKRGLCDICGVEGPLYIDHCHVTEKRRGLLCRNCNFVLGLAADDPDVLIKAARYLQHYGAGNG
ncbi:MAG: hypothetical protein KGL39_41975 [Patescibacteria group bacterium]|nr:hypothetical protein [Patescibacteria group bacterium]